MNLKAYMTNGTFAYLEEMQEKHVISPFLLLENDIKTVAYYEDEKPSVFTESRDYQIIAKQGSLEEQGYASLSFIPVTTEGLPIFESEYKKVIQQFSSVVAARLLRPMQGNIYVILLEWTDLQDYHKWQADSPLPTKKNRPYLNGPAYNEIFQVGRQEEEDTNEG
ncbi:antibiotic biosynthesis monooxygenase family protein [Gracilibacillus alcaliphilus]|uniref:antibiotic biosynthesis monooxygenase family protein n=1 Tax=Gracilibacillus alcaliphilus TaxID=1401441 RepID=UPI00195AFD57|nr:hypothetical protein [Gracilibacillus alcaliphilus]MBM7675412.1 heme-degrading monooxygenase HmoA [Gracilibacillus alcaliphilus]